MILILGLTSDVITSMTSAADTWEQISISFTPPKQVNVKLEYWYMEVPHTVPMLMHLQSHKYNESFNTRIIRTK